MNLKGHTHDETVLVLKLLLSSKPLNPADAERIAKLAEARSLSRKEKLETQSFVLKYQLKTLT